MTKIIYKKGDLVDATERYILHGCNAQGVMNSGVAKAIRERWPIVYTEYKEFIEQASLEFEKKDIVGMICTSYVKPRPELLDKVSWQIVINGITQERYGKDGQLYVSYDGIRSVMRECERRFRGKEIAMPKIGSGLGGGDWDVISEIIEEEAITFQPVVYIP